MPMNLDNLVSLLKSEELRIRTGLLMVEPGGLPLVKEFGATLGLHCEDACELILRRTPEERKTIGLNVALVFEILTEIVDDATISGSCVMVSNLDIVLAGLGQSERDRFWYSLRGTFRRNRGLLAVFPVGAIAWMPVEERAIWEKDGRLVYSSLGGL